MESIFASIRRTGPPVNNDDDFLQDETDINVFEN